MTESEKQVMQDAHDYLKDYPSPECPTMRDATYRAYMRGSEVARSRAQKELAPLIDFLCQLNWDHPGLVPGDLVPLLDKHIMDKEGK